LLSHQLSQMHIEQSPTSTSTLIHAALIGIGAGVSEFTYPLFAADDRGRPDLYATSVLIEYDGVPILLTAAHAVYQIQNSGSMVYVGTSDTFIPMEGFILSSPNGADSLDLAAVVIPEKHWPHFRSPLPLDHATQQPSTEPHLRCIHGYPITKNTSSKSVNEATKKFSLRGFTYAGASKNLELEYAKFKKDISLHIALKYQKQGKNNDGLIVSPPKPTGISGGGLWMVPDIRNYTNFRLEGIAIEYHARGQIVFATRIEHVIRFIGDNVMLSNI
jgi:hypothetical protein